jgi:hypothetical protein
MTKDLSFGGSPDEKDCVDPMVDIIQDFVLRFKTAY